MRSIHLALAAALAVLPAMRVSAQTASAPAAEARVLDQAVVRAPGPGLWKVYRGDHVMWVLGTVSPLPADMAWNSARMRALVASADAVIREPSLVIDAKLGFFAKLALLPSVIGVRSLPDDKHLGDVLPPATHARWSRLKREYIGSDSTVEGWRPVFAGERLYDRALRRHGLSSRDVVLAAVAEAAKARGLQMTAPTAKLTLADPKAVLKDFKRTDLTDVRCFEAILDRVENEMGALGARADAWASGDIAALRTMVHADPGDTCMDAVLGGSVGAKYGIDRLHAQAEAKWLADAEASLAEHRSTVAVMSMHDVLGSNGLLARLAAKGYRVEAPDAASPADASAAVGGL